MLEIKNILCAVDFSEMSPRVASYAQALAENLKAKVHVLYVAPSIEQYSYLRLPPTDFQDHVSETIIDAERTMEAFIQKNFTMANVSGRVLSGYVAEIILDFAKIENIDLIVMGTRGRQGVDRIFIGSVAEKVIKSSTIPVLSVRPG